MKNTVTLKARLLLVLCGLMMPVSSAEAVFSGDMSPRARSGDVQYADGIEAFEAKNWEKVVYHMSRVVSRRPHHDNAWARLGFAHRKLGRYEASLFAYGRSLSINPHNRAAMEYLGEAYVELGRFVEAVDMLHRLGRECERVSVTFSDGSFGDGCEEYTSLKTLIELVGGDTTGVADRW